MRGMFKKWCHWRIQDIGLMLQNPDLFFELHQGNLSFEKKKGELIMMMCMKILVYCAAFFVLKL